MAIRFPGRAAVAVSVLAVATVVAACQPAPAAAPTPAAPAASNKLFISNDVVQGSANIPEDQKAAKSCVFSSRFPRNSQIVWRAKIFDPMTGETIGDDVKAQIKLANGTNIDMRYRPPSNDPAGEKFWTGSWKVPVDAPTGTLNYTIVATDSKGRTGEFVPLPVASALLQITNEVLPEIPAKPKA